MVIQNLSKIYSNHFLKSDHIVVSISSRLSLEEIYEQIKEGTLSSEDAEILVYKKTGEEGPLFETFLPPYEETSGWDKVSSAEFDKFLGGQEEYKNAFSETPVVFNEEEATESSFIFVKDLLPYFSASLGILPELEGKDLPFEEKKRLSEITSLFYKEIAPITPLNAPPQYEDLLTYQSLSLYEQRVIRQWSIDLTRDDDDEVLNNAAQAKITQEQLEVIRYCKDASLNGFGILPITEELVSNLTRRHQGKKNRKESAVKKFANVDAHLLSGLGLENVDFPDAILRHITTTLSNQDALTEDGIYALKLTLNAYAPERILFDNLEIPQGLQGGPDKYLAVLRTILNSGAAFTQEDVEHIINTYMLPAVIEDLALRRASELTQVFLNQEDTSEQALGEFLKKVVEERFPKKEDELLKELETLFANSKHKRAPRLSYEILRAFQHQKQRTVTKEELKEIVEHFSLNSFKKIAGEHSVNLMNLSRYMDLSTMKSSHLDIFRVKDLDVKALSKAGFFDWYNTHKNVTPSELFELLSANADEFDKQFSAKDILRRSKMKRSYEEVKRIENNWHIKFSDNDIAVQGREIVVTDGRWTAEICDKDDPRQTTSGIDTSCCQRYGGAGGTCVRDILTNPLSCNLIITDNETGRIEAQSYIWSDPSKDAIVLDNIEFRPEHDKSTKKFLPLLAAWCEQMPQKNIHVGTGYNESFRGVGIKLSPKDACHRIVLNDMEHVYSDYHTTGAHAARILKKEGTLTISPSRNAIVRQKERLSSALETICPATEFFRLTIPGIHSATDYEQFKRNAADPNNEEWIREKIGVAIQTKNTSYIDLFAMVPEDQQNFLFEIDSSVVPKIKNPTTSVLSKYLALNPAEIQKYPDLDSSIMKHLYAQNGLLIRKAPTRNLECQRAAVTNEPLAVLYLKESPIFNELLEMAIKKLPSIVKFFPDAEDSFWNKAIWRDPFVIRHKKNPTTWQKETAIKKNPAVVYSIRNANKKDFALADQLLTQKKTEDTLKRQISRQEEEQFNPFFQLAH